VIEGGRPSKSSIPAEQLKSQVFRINGVIGHESLAPFKQSSPSYYTDLDMEFYNGAGDEGLMILYRTSRKFLGS
jgi:hypothetical protein